MPNSPQQTIPTLNTSDWQHLDQTVKMLYLAIAQIESALGEGNENTEIIGGTFLNMRKHVKAIRDSENVTENCDAIEKQLMVAVAAFQFYDRLSQRVNHVQSGLKTLIDVMGNMDQLNDLEVWPRIQDEIRASYTMESEREMFDKIMQGHSIEEAIAILHNTIKNQPMKEDSDGDVVDLF